MSNANTWYSGNAVNMGWYTGYAGSYYQQYGMFQISEDETSATITIYGNCYFEEWTGMTNGQMVIDGTTVVSGGLGPASPPTGYSGQKSVARTVTKTHSPQTKNYVVKGVSGGDWSSLTLSVPIYPKTSYQVAYDANGGTGAPGNQTKWYDETLALSSTIPVLSGYSFSGWATSKARADAGIVDYIAGANYTNNAAATLYAVWKSEGTVRVFNGEEFKQAIPYIYNENEFKRTTANIYTEDEWKQGI